MSISIPLAALNSGSRQCLTTRLFYQFMASVTPFYDCTIDDQMAKIQNKVGNTRELLVTSFVEKLKNLHVCSTWKRVACRFVAKTTSNQYCCIFHGLHSNWNTNKQYLKYSALLRQIHLLFSTFTYSIMCFCTHAELHTYTYTSSTSAPEYYVYIDKH